MNDEEKKELMQIHAEINQADSYEEKIDAFNEWAEGKQFNGYTLAPLVRIESEELLEQNSISEADVEDLADTIKGSIA